MAAHILGFDHVQLAMPTGGEAAARSFYSGVLGMEEIPKPAHLAVNGGCWFVSQGAHIHLGAEDGFTPARKAHPALLVKDLAALIAHLEQSSIAYCQGKPLQGYVRGDIADPFGNRIEVMERI